MVGLLDTWNISDDVIGYVAVHKHLSELKFYSDYLNSVLFARLKRKISFNYDI